MSARVNRNSLSVQKGGMANTSNEQALRESKASLPDAYPSTAVQLTRNDLKVLTRVLHIDITVLSPDKRHDQVKKLIEDLPYQLRSAWVFRLIPNRICPAAVLCAVHKSLNAYIIANILGLVKDEVTHNLSSIREYPGVLWNKPDLVDMIKQLEGLQGMWVMPTLTCGLPHPWDYQADKCEGCMLSRVAASPWALQLLRTTLLSRARSRTKVHVPKLLPFIDECIIQHDDLKKELFYCSGMVSVTLKLCRKVAGKFHHAKVTGRGFRFDPSAWKLDLPRELSRLTSRSGGCGQTSGIDAEGEIIKIWASTRIREEMDAMDEQARQSSSTSDNPFSDRYETDLCYVGPRSDTEWRDAVKRGRDKDGVEIPAPLRWSKRGHQGRLPVRLFQSERLAELYRAELKPYLSDDLPNTPSDADYEAWTGDLQDWDDYSMGGPAPRPKPGDTTWSLVCDDEV